MADSTDPYEGRAADWLFPRGTLGEEGSDDGAPPGGWVATGCALACVRRVRSLRRVRRVHMCVHAHVWGREAGGWRLAGCGCCTGGSIQVSTIAAAIGLADCAPLSQGLGA